MSRLPFLLVGDGPGEPSGLGRILRDLASQILASDLPVDLVTVGGETLPLWTAWRHVPMGEAARGSDWGAGYVQQVYHDLWGSQPGILFIVWDPGRLLPYTQIQLPVERWTYTAIDAANISGRISGPAQAALWQFDRVLAYGRWASTILKATLEHPISYLPHGLSLDVYAQPASEDETRWVDAFFGPYCKPGAVKIGAVMTNQPRKDLGLFFHTLRLLQDRGRKVFGWLHTDVAVKAWAVQQLVEDFGLSKSCIVTLDQYTDRQLALLYQACDLTMLPSLGEGFGYPIVESLASGTPCLHSDCAGGKELVPRTEWRPPVRMQRLESIYALQRPVFQAEDWANAAERTLDWQERMGRTVVQAYCRGAVAHLGWTNLWPRWYSWIRQGLAA